MGGKKSTEIFGGKWKLDRVQALQPVAILSPSPSQSRMSSLATVSRDVSPQLPDATGVAGRAVTYIPTDTAIFKPGSLEFIIIWFICCYLCLLFMVFFFPSVRMLRLQGTQCKMQVLL